MRDAIKDIPLYDRTARRTHQWTMVVLVAAGLVIQGVAGGLLIAVAGLIMLVGRFWWPADLVRQLVWRALAPAGLPEREDVQPAHDARRGARGRRAGLVEAARRWPGDRRTAVVCAWGGAGRKAIPGRLLNAKLHGLPYRAVSRG